MNNDFKKHGTSNVPVNMSIYSCCEHSMVKVANKQQK